MLNIFLFVPPFSIILLLLSLIAFFHFIISNYNNTNNSNNNLNNSFNSRNNSNNSINSINSINNSNNNGNDQSGERKWGKTWDSPINVQKSGNSRRMLGSSRNPDKEDVPYSPRTPPRDNNNTTNNINNNIDSNNDSNGNLNSTINSNVNSKINTEFSSQINNNNTAEPKKSKKTVNVTHSTHAVDQLTSGKKTITRSSFYFNYLNKVNVN